MDNYLKKHKLDLKILPNKKMIKLSDLTASLYSSTSSTSTTAQDSLLDENANELLFANKITSVEDKDLQLNDQHSQECEEIYDEYDEYDNEVEEEEEDDEGDDDDEGEEEEEEEIDGEDEDGDEDDYDGDFLDDDDDLGDFIENYRNNEKETDEVDDALNVTSESTTNSIQEFKIDTSEMDGKRFEHFLQ